MTSFYVYPICLLFIYFEFYLLSTFTKPTFYNVLPTIFADVTLPDIGRLDGYTTRRPDAGLDDVFGEGNTRYVFTNIKW